MLHKTTITVFQSNPPLAIMNIWERQSSRWTFVALDEERLVLLKPVVHLSFTYDVFRGLLYNYLTFITSLFIYCEESLPLTVTFPRNKNIKTANES